MRRNVIVVALILLGFAVISAGWLWWALGPGAPKELAQTALPPLPPPPSAAPVPPPPAASHSAPIETKSVDATPTLKVGLLDQGTLAVEARGQRFATENYALERLPSGEISLHSQGTLTFKIAFVNTQATFVQALRVDAQRRPQSYQLAINGPMGIGNRKVGASFSGTQGIFNDGEKDTEIALPEEPFVLLGMFSSYVTLTLWADPQKPQPLKIMAIRGERRNSSPELPSIILERVGSVQLRGRDVTPIEAQEYLLNSERFQMRLYLDGARFLGLRSAATEQDPEGAFLIYRHDLFPQGFEVLRTP